jgi:hypothetical protein
MYEHNACVSNLLHILKVFMSHDCLLKVFVKNKETMFLWQCALCGFLMYLVMEECPDYRVPI